MNLVLYLSLSEQQLWRRDGKVWQRWTGDPDGPVCVVTDFPEESFSEIKTPRLFGQDRSAYIARQLANAFPDSPYRTFLTPAQSGSLYDKIAPTRHVLLGINTAERLDAVLDALTAPVSGVWPISVLLVHLCKRHELPADLLVAMPGVDTLRIVYLKNHGPVLVRLTTTPNEIGTQIDEISRTLRYLENSQVLPRKPDFQPVLFLGNSSGSEAQMTAARLSLVSLRGKDSAQADWRLALFDIALKSPAGQVAPLLRRTGYLSARVRKAAQVAALVLIAVGVLAVGSNAFSIFGLLAKKHEQSVSSEQVNARIATVDAQINHVNVAPDEVRRAVALYNKEIASVPPLTQHLQFVAGLLASDPNLRLRDLAWRMLPPAEQPCAAAGGAAPATTTGDNVPAAAPDADARKIEISFELAIPGDYGPRLRALTLRNISSRIAETPGVTVVRDATRDFVGGSLHGGSEGAESGKLLWCVTLPGDAAVSPPPVPAPANGKLTP